MSKEKFTLIKLTNFKGGLHLSRGRSDSYAESQNLLHSDTLKSAIFVCALSLYGKGEIDKNFLERFSISSAFPFMKKNGKDVFFFPKPNSHLNIELKTKSGENIKGKPKILKKLAFLDKPLFEKVINGTPVSLDHEKDIEKGYAGSKLGNSVSNIYLNDAYQHVSIWRDGKEDSVPYYVDKRYFRPDAGLFFLMKANDETTKKQVFSALRLLADSGLGTDRNNGNGMFKFQGKQGQDVIDDFELMVPDDGGHELALSLYLPASQEEMGDLDNAQYELIKRGGYIANPANTNHLTLRKRSVHMFKEGSIFEKVDNRAGDIVDLKPNNKDLENVNIKKVDHPIYRDGRAIFIPFKTYEL